MLRTLSVRDVVLIDRLELGFEAGLGVLTGETGAGKSILLDALGLALGVRGDSALVRHGAQRASVTAAFDLGTGHPAHRILDEHGLEEVDGGLVLRRILGADGRSRAFVNDRPTSVTLLREIGETLVDIHGQFESQRLLEPACHRELLDAYGGHKARLAATAAAFRAWRTATKVRAEAEQAVIIASRDEAFLRHAADEIDTLALHPGEEAELAQRRSLLMHAEKMAEAMAQATAEMTAGRGVETQLAAARHHLERVAAKAEGRLDAVIQAFARASTEAAEATALLEKTGASLDLDPRHLETAEARLFALRAVARKHGVEVAALAEVRQSLARRLAAIEDGGAGVERLVRVEAERRQDYLGAAEALGEARAQAAVRLDAAVNGELKPLKLGLASFVTRVESLAEEAWGEAGRERVAFQVVTNPGSPPGPLARISSGGELARFMLALKVVLARADPVPTIIFDEVDHGVGGAVAAAVGERLARLARDFQVLVVTHSPQVAARGTYHWLVSKKVAEPGALTTVDTLGAAGRREEIARMLAGARVTDEARAAAGRLLEAMAP